MIQRNTMVSDTLCRRYSKSIFDYESSQCCHPSTSQTFVCVCVCVKVFKYFYAIKLTNCRKGGKVNYSGGGG